MHVCLCPLSPTQWTLCKLHSTPLHKCGTNKTPQVIRPSFQPLDGYTQDTLFSVVLSLPHLHMRPISMTKAKGNL